MTALVAEIVRTLRHVAGDDRGGVALHEPRFAGNEWDYVKQCIDTGWVSTAGSFVGAFEQRLAQACGVRHAIAIVNGTAALHLALIMAGVRTGDEVIVPTLTFVATANAVSHAGALPHLVDSDAATLGLDPDKLDAHLQSSCEPGATGPINRHTGRRISAVVPMHVFGHPVDMDRLQHVAARHRLVVIEDAAESLGSTYRGRATGSLGLLAALSFNGNKIITTGGGGAILTDDDDLAQRTRHIATTAKRAHRWEFDHDAVAYNYRLPNLNAALGCAQMEQLPAFVQAKRRLAARYIEAFSHIDGLSVFREPPFAVSNYWLNAILLDTANAQLRNEILAATNDAGLMTRPVWKLMHRLPMYASCPRSDLSAAESLESRIINIPSSATLGLG